jgi:tetratricopeptide (TPR) repeat protein
VKKAAERGVAVAGICNGFQILCEAQMLPGALLRNARLKYVCKAVDLEIVNGQTRWTAGFQGRRQARMTVGNGEGNFFADEATLDRLRKAMRRHRGKVAATVAIGAVAAAGLVATWMQAERAQREARNARSINAFLTDLFRAADPDEALGDDPPASELFRRGATKARSEYRAEPVLQAALLFEIGRIQKERGQYADADSSLSEALRLRRERFGPESVPAAEVAVEIGQLRYHQGKLSEAIALLRTAVATFERTSPPDANTLPEAEISLAEMLMVDGQFEASRDLCNRVIARLGPDSGQEKLRAGAFETLGAALQGLGDLDAAASAIDDAVASERRLSPAGSTDLAIFLSDLGFVRLDQGDFAGAEAAFAESLALKRRLFGPQHVQVVSALNNLAYAQTYLGRAAEAVASAAESVRIARILFPAPHPDLAAALAAYGNALRGADRSLAAEQAYSQALAVWQGIDEAERTSSLTSAQAQYAAVLADLGRFREALGYLDSAIAHYAAEEGHGGPRMDAARARRGFVLARLGRATEAITELEATLPELAATRFGWRSSDYFAWQSAYAGALLDAGRPADAAAALAEMRRHLSERREPRWSRFEEDLAALAARLREVR